jgi:hypothetical protein
MQRKICGDCREQNRRNRRSIHGPLQQQIAQRVRSPRFVVALNEDMLVGKALLRDGNEHADKIGIHVFCAKDVLVGELKECCTKECEKSLKSNATDERSRERGAKEYVASDRVQRGPAEQFLAIHRQRPIRFHTVDAGRNNRILQDQFLGVVLARSESDCFLEVDRRFVEPIQSLIRRCEIVVTGRVERIRSDSFAQRFHRRLMTAGNLMHQPQQIQGVNVVRRAIENLIAQDFSAIRAAVRVIPARLGHKCGDREEAGLAILSGSPIYDKIIRLCPCATCFSVHAAR